MTVTTAPRLALVTLALDLVALATVCDVMPLTGVNRALVAHGLAAAKHLMNIVRRCKQGMHQRIAGEAVLSDLDRSW